MFRITRTKIIGLAMVGVVALGGATYATMALAAGGAAASPAAAEAVQGATDPQLRASILDMLKDRMGLTGPDAEQFADQMIARMQNVDPDFGVQEMVDWCTQCASDGTYGPGMMDGYGMMDDADWGYGGYGMMDDDHSAYGGYGMMYSMMGAGDAAYDGWGMMGGTPTTDVGPSGESATAPDRPGAQESGSGFTPGSMMGGSAYGNDSANDGEYMMDAVPGPNAGPSNQGDQGGNTPSDPGPPDEDSSPAYGGVMGSGMMGR